ncbi:MAG: TetR/AcrR family transcriptional regulator [Solirubrobacteraceae bacterium]|jgi:AcrR family transcriptional regulator
MPRPRLTRKERQAHTRTCLMESAARIFTRRGLDQASIDEVAADAGYTKGAFYANFKSKEELFLAMLDERFAERLEELDRVLASEGTVEEQAREAGASFMRHVSADPEWQRLFLEFAAYAARNEDFRQELVTRYGTLRKRMAEAFHGHARSQGIDSTPERKEEMALMLFAMANGVALEKLLEPDVVPDDLYSTMLVIFFTGLRALSTAEEPAQPAGRAG